MKDRKTRAQHSIRHDAEFDCTPAQYHAAIDKLWKALELTTPQEHDCFTLAAKEIVRLRKRVKELEDHLDGGHHASFCETSRREVYEVLETETWEEQWNDAGLYWTEQQAKEEIVRLRRKRRADSTLSDEEFDRWWRWTIRKKSLFGSPR